MELFDIIGRAVMKMATSPTTIPVSDTAIPLPLDTVVTDRGGFSADPANATFTVPSDGDYGITVHLNGDWNNGDDLEIALWINGTQQGAMLSQNGRGARHQTMSWTAYLDGLTAGDTLQVQLLDADGGSFDATIHACTLACVRVG